MAHKNILEIFQQRFFDLYSQVKEWFPNGRGSIRIRTSDKQDFVFTYYGEKDWCLETLDRYISNMKGEKRK